MASVQTTLKKNFLRKKKEKHKNLPTKVGAFYISSLPLWFNGRKTFPSELRKPTRYLQYTYVRVTESGPPRISYSELFQKIICF